MTRILTQSLLAFFCTITLVVLLRDTARRMGLVDNPGGRKHHRGRIPLVGGIAIFGGFGFSALLLGQSDPPLYEFRALLGGMGLLVLAGVLDDMHDLSPFAKLGLQTGAALLMASWGGVYVRELGDLFGTGSSLPLGNFAIPFTVVCALGTINALNMTDGVDGLAGGLAAVSLAAFALIAYRTGQLTHLLVLGMLGGGVLGFLSFNMRHPLRHRASVFLGDAGSMSLGFALCWFAVSLTRPSEVAVPPIAMVWLIAVPLIDMGVVILRRIASRRSPFAADREHLHHLLLRSGVSDGVTTLLLLTSALACAGVGLAIASKLISAAAGFYGFVALAIAATTAVQLMSRRLRGRLPRDRQANGVTVPEPASKVVVLRDGGAVGSETRESTQR